MREVEAHEAGVSFAKLLELVAGGEEVSIQKEGTEVARLVPPRCGQAKTNVDREQARAAAQRIRERAKAAKHGPFNWDEWKAYRDEGRR